jgi:hypothetical protein
VLATTGASAQPTAKSASATAEFDRGRELAKDGNWAEACAAFERSEQLEAAYGTLYNLAGCYVHVGKLASAWAAFRELAQRDTNPTRRSDAARQAEELRPRLPRLTIAIGSKPAGLAVSLDGSDVTNLLGSDTPVDLGTHTIEADAPGFEHVRTTFEVGEERATPTVSLRLVRAKTPPASPAPTHTEKPAPSSSRRIYGIVVGAGGVALVATGLVFGELAHRKYDTAKQLCPDHACGSDADLASAQSLLRDSRLRANVATGLSIGGAAAIGVGAILWLTAPSSRAHVALQAGGTWGAAIEGRW